MGGLRRLMPITFVTFLIGALSQAGIPPLAGFFAKDAVLEVANHTGRQAVFVLGTLGAFVTAFYLGRMLILTFFGQPRSDAASHAHESRGLMLVPLAILGVGAVVVGSLNLSPEGMLRRAARARDGPDPGGSGRPRRARDLGDRDDHRDRGARRHVVDLRLGPRRPDGPPRAARAAAAGRARWVVRRPRVRRGRRPARQAARAAHGHGGRRRDHRRGRQRGRRAHDPPRGRRAHPAERVRAHLRVRGVPRAWSRSSAWVGLR